MSQYFTNDFNLRSEYRNIIYKYRDYSFSFLSDLGVFSKDRIDFGSRLLVETIFENSKKNLNVLDVGCGYGFIGISISRILNSYVDMIDVNKRAIHLANINIKNLSANANAFISNIYSNVNKKYDLIVSNPPIRAGKDIYMNIINNAKDYLVDDGEFWFVMHKDQGAKTVIEKIKNIYDVNVMNKDKGFFVILCKKH